MSNSILLKPSFPLFMWKFPLLRSNQVVLLYWQIKFSNFDTLSVASFPKLQNQHLRVQCTYDKMRCVLARRELNLMPTSILFMSFTILLTNSFWLSIFRRDSNFSLELHYTIIRRTSPLFLRVPNLEPGTFLVQASMLIVIYLPRDTPAQQIPAL